MTTRGKRSTGRDERDGIAVEVDTIAWGDGTYTVDSATVRGWAVVSPEGEVRGWYGPSGQFLDATGERHGPGTSADMCEYCALPWPHDLSGEHRGVTEPTTVAGWQFWRSHAVKGLEDKLARVIVRIEEEARGEARQRVAALEVALREAIYAFETVPAGLMGKEPSAVVVSAASILRHAAREAHRVLFPDPNNQPPDADNDGPRFGVGK